MASFLAGGKDKAAFWPKLAAYSALGAMKSFHADMAVFLSVMLAVLNMVCCATADAATVEFVAYIYAKSVRL